MEPSFHIAFTIPDAVKATGIARSRLYTLIGEKAIRAVKSGKRTLVTADSLRAYIAGLPAAQISPGRE